MVASPRRPSEGHFQDRDPSRTVILNQRDREEIRCCPSRGSRLLMLFRKRVRDARSRAEQGPRAAAAIMERGLQKGALLPKSALRVAGQQGAYAG